MTAQQCHNTDPKEKKTCPVCGGKKTVQGTCTCDMEWRGTTVDDQMEDCQCTPEVTCPSCNGTGFVVS